MGRPRKYAKEDEATLNVNLLKEVVRILSETDNKIKILLDCSEKDFLNQNNQLKQYYSKIKTISNNSFAINDMLNFSESKNLSLEISDYQNYLSSKSESLNKRFKMHIKLAEEIKIKNNQLFGPLVKYKQNTAALKLLIKNYKKNFININENKIGDTSVDSIEALIAKMEAIFPLIEDSLNKLETHSGSLFVNLMEIDKKNLINYSNMLYKFSLNNMEIIGILDEKTSKAPILKDNAEQSLRCVNKIISNLQFEDIISQKINHINNIHKEIISELKIAEASEEYNIDISPFKLASRIPDVAELQVAQLIYSNQEYKTAIETIKSKFIEIAGFLNSFSDVGNQFSKSYVRFDKDIKNELHSKLNEVTAIFEDFYNFKKEYAKELKAIDKLSDEIYGYLTSLNIINNNIEQLTFNITRKHMSSKDQKDIVAFANEIGNVASENNKELHNIQFIYATIQKNSKFLVLSIDNTRADILMLKRNNEFLESVDNCFKIINKEFPVVMNLIEEGILLSNSVSKELISTKNNMNLFITFNDTIEEIISNLNHIHKQLRAENIDINQFKRDLAPKNKESRGSSTSKVVYNRTLNKLKGKNYLNNNLYLQSKKDKEAELF